MLAAKRLKDAGMRVTFVLWHQGEANAAPDLAYRESGLDKHARLWLETIRQFNAAKDRSALPRVTAKTIGAGPERP